MILICATVSVFAIGLEEAEADPLFIQGESKHVATSIHSAAVRSDAIEARHGRRAGHPARRVRRAPFVLGDTTGGIIRLAITFVTCGAGSIIGLIEGIIYLTKSEQDFYETYLVQKKAWF